MNCKQIVFRICDFSEQFISPTPETRHYVYSAVAHVDGKVFHWKQAIRSDFCPPISALRSQGWLALLEQIAEGK